MQTDLQKAQYIWTILSGLNKADEHLVLDTLTADIPKTPAGGWLKACRESLLLSQPQVGSRMKLSRQGYANLENRENDSSITLDSLRKAAEALDCELVYFVRPKQRKKFSTIAWEKILPKTAELYKSRVRSTVIKPLIFAKIGMSLFENPKIRRQMKWARNNSSPS